MWSTVRNRQNYICVKYPWGCKHRNPRNAWLLLPRISRRPFPPTRSEWFLSPPSGSLWRMGALLQSNSLCRSHTASPPLENLAFWCLHLPWTWTHSFILLVFSIPNAQCTLRTSFSGLLILLSLPRRIDLRTVNTNTLCHPVLNWSKV